MKRIGARLLASVVVRSFLIQGSWNYRTMLGSGFAFAILPVLRYLYGDRGRELRRALSRHAEHFNAHPYLASLALGAACRMEAEGRSPEEIRRFKAAVRGPLGSLGDALVWASWRPATILLGMALALAGAPVWLAVGVFLGLYNVLHLVLRIWGFRAGFRFGHQLAGTLRSWALAGRAEQVRRVGVVLLGVTAGLIGVRGVGAAGGEAVPWMLLALAGLVLGERLGQRAWRGAALGTVVVVGGLIIGGVLTG